MGGERERERERERASEKERKKVCVRERERGGWLYRTPTADKISKVSPLLD